MSSDARDFNNIETRAVINSFFLQGKSPKEIHAILKEILGKHAPSYSTVTYLVAQFELGDFSTCDALRPGRPKAVTTPEFIDHIHELMLEDRPISGESIAEHLGILPEWVGSIIHEDLDMRKLSSIGSQNARTRIKNFNGDSRLNKIWNFFGSIQMISCRYW
jgi:transposase